MRWHLEGKAWKVCLSTGTILAISTSISYAEPYNLLVMLELPDDIQKQVTSLQVKSHQDLPDSLVMLALPTDIREELTNTLVKSNQKLPENILAQEDNKKGNNDEEIFIKTPTGSEPLLKEKPEQKEEEKIELPENSSDQETDTEDIAPKEADVLKEKTGTGEPALKEENLFRDEPAKGDTLPKEENLFRDEPAKSDTVPKEENLLRDEPAKDDTVPKEENLFRDEPAKGDTVPKEENLFRDEPAKGDTVPKEENLFRDETDTKETNPQEADILKEETNTEETVPKEADTGEEASKKFEVTKIEVKGSTIFKQEQFNPLTQPLEGRSISLKELEEVASGITKLYADKGYITSKAVVTPQSLTNGVVTISVIEGVIDKIEVQGTKRFTSYVRSRIALGLSKPVSSVDLENQLRLLRTDPLFSNIEASLRQVTSDELGKNTLVVRVTEAKSFQATLSADNYSPPSVGSERFGINTSYNLTGLGDQLALSYYFTPRGGSNVYDVSYQVPVNTMNGTVQLRTSINNNKVIQEPFKVFDIHGESQLYEINYRQPLVRSPRQEFALSLGFSVQDGQTFTFAGATPFGFGPDEQGNSRTRVIKFGQDYLLRDAQGVWALRSSLNFGVDVFDPTINADPIPDGRFFSWLGQIQRVQRLGNDNILIGQAQVQLTPNSLLPSQQFVIGGGQSVRGYRQNSRAGDNGVRFVLENQVTVSKDANGNSVFRVAPFFDLGYVWNTTDNPNRLQSQTFLAGTGVGVLWQVVPNLNLRLDYSLPLINLNDRGVNAQDDGFYFNMAYKL